MKKLRRVLRPSLKGIFNYVFAVLADLKYPFEDIFKSDTIEYADGIALNTNFTRSQMSAKKVNKYVSIKNQFKTYVNINIFSRFFTEMCYWNIFYFL